MKRCTKCGHITEEGNHCTECGSPLIEMESDEQTVEQNREPTDNTEDSQEANSENLDRDINDYELEDISAYDTDHISADNYDETVSEDFTDDDDASTVVGSAANDIKETASENPRDDNNVPDLNDPAVNDHNSDVKIESINVKKPKKSSKISKAKIKKIAIIVIAAIVLIVAVIFIAKAIEKKNTIADLNSTIENAQETSFVGLTSVHPKGWKIVKDYTSKITSYWQGYAQNGNYIGNECIECLGYGNVDLNKVVSGFPDEDLCDISDLDFSDFSIYGGTGQYVEYILTNDNGDKYAYYVAAVKVDGFNFGFMYCTLDDYYSTEQAKNLLSRFDFKNYKAPKITSMKATYSGSDDGGIKIDDNSKKIKVNVTFDNEVNMDVTEWTIENPGKTRWGTTNTYKIKYGPSTCNLKIKTKKSFKQVYNKVRKEISESNLLTSGFFDNEYEDVSDIGGRIFITEYLKEDIYQYMLLAEKGSDVERVWRACLLRYSIFCSELSDEFEKEGYKDVSVIMTIMNPGFGSGSFSEVRSNEGITENYYDESNY